MGGQEHTHTAPHHAHVQGDDPSVWSCKQCGIDDMESNIICDLCNEVWHVSCLEPEVRDAAAEAQIDSSVLIERITNNETTLDNALTEQGALVLSRLHMPADGRAARGGFSSFCTCRYVTCSLSICIL